MAGDLSLLPVSEDHFHPCFLLCYQKADISLTSPPSLALQIAEVDFEDEDCEEGGGSGGSAAGLATADELMVRMMVLHGKCQDGTAIRADMDLLRDLSGQMERLVRSMAAASDGGSTLFRTRAQVCVYPDSLRHVTQPMLSGGLTAAILLNQPQQTFRAGRAREIRHTLPLLAQAEKVLLLFAFDATGKCSYFVLALQRYSHFLAGACYPQHGR